MLVRRRCSSDDSARPKQRASYGSQRVDAEVRRLCGGNVAMQVDRTRAPIAMVGMVALVGRATLIDGVA